MRMISVLAFMLLLACPAAAKTDRGLKYLEKAARKAGTSMSGKLFGKICVLDFTNLATPETTSEFGQKTAELIAAQLVGRGGERYKVIERRELMKIVRDTLLIAGDDEEVLKRIRNEGGADILVSGSYSASGSEVSIDAKAVDAKSLQVLAATTVRLHRTEGLDRMLGRQMIGGRPKESEEIQTTGIDPLEIEAGVFYEGGDAKLYPLREGMVLNSKDNYALYFKPAKASYVYAYQVDSSQKAHRIFPNPDYTRSVNPLPAAEVWLPEGGDYLYLDENPGREDIYVFATRAPSPTLENLKSARLPDIQAAIKTMGVAGRRGTQVLSKAKGTHGNPLELITRKLLAEGDFFWKISFIHQ